MESLLEPVELNRETTQALDEIRSGAKNELYGAASADAEEKVNNSVLPLIEGAGLPGLHVMHYRWYLRELARHWRTRRGRDLAFHLELCIRKWVGLGLEPRTLQFLISEAHQRLKGKAEGQSGNDEGRTESAASASSAVASPVSESGQSAESAKSADDRGTLPGIMAGPRPPVDPAASASTTKTPSHQGSGPETTSAESAKSADVCSGSSPEVLS